MYVRLALSSRAIRSCLFFRRLFATHLVCGSSQPRPRCKLVDPKHAWLTDFWITKRIPLLSRNVNATDTPPPNICRYSFCRIFCHTRSSTSRKDYVYLHHLEAVVAMVVFRVVENAACRQETSTTHSNACNLHQRHVSEIRRRFGSACIFLTL